MSGIEVLLDREIIEEIDKISRRNLLELENYYINNCEVLKEEFLESFKEICEKITKMKKNDTNNITYSMLRTNLARGRNIYLVEASNTIEFVDKDSIKSKYNVEWAFKYFDEFKEELNQIKEIYWQDIKSYQIKSIKLNEADKYNKYILKLAIYALKDIDNLKEFKELNTRQGFQVRVEDYRHVSKVAYRKL